MVILWGLKSKDKKSYREQNTELVFQPKNPRGFFSLYQVPKQRKMKGDSKVSGKLCVSLIITHSSMQLFLMLIILL